MAITLSVGSINVLVNLFVIAVVLAGSELARFAVYKATQLRLKRHGRAPLLTDPDNPWDRLQNSFRGARRSRSPIIISVVALSFSLIIAEISSEFGVESSERCSPKRIISDGICASEREFPPSKSRTIAQAFHARQVGWNDNDLTKYPIYEGLRHNYDGSEAFSERPSNPDTRILVANCSVTPPVYLPANDARIILDVSGNVGASVVGMDVSIGGMKRKMTGPGDLTHSGLHLSAILCCPQNDTIERQRVTVLEYHDSDNIRLSLASFFKTIGSKFASELVIINQSPVTMYDVSCGKVPDTRLFASGLRTFRTVQLEDISYGMVNVTVGGRIMKTYPPMTASDVVRSGIALAALNGARCNGETFVYTKCGIYKWIYMVPLLSLFLLIVIVAIVKSIMVIREKADINIPHTSSAWSELALETSSGFPEGGAEEGGAEEGGEEEEGQPVLHRAFYELHETADGKYDVQFAYKPIQNTQSIAQSVRRSMRMSRKGAPQ